MDHIRLSRRPDRERRRARRAFVCSRYVDEGERQHAHHDRRSCRRGGDRGRACGGDRRRSSPGWPGRCHARPERLGGARDPPPPHLRRRPRHPPRPRCCCPTCAACGRVISPSRSSVTSAGCASPPPSPTSGRGRCSCSRGGVRDARVPNIPPSRSCTETERRRVFQRSRDRTDRRRDVGCMLRHPGHRHWHFDAMAAYSLRRPGTDNALVSRNKVSFCLRDNRRVPGQRVVVRRALRPVLAQQPARDLSGLGRRLHGRPGRAVAPAAARRERRSGLSGPDG